MACSLSVNNKCDACFNWPGGTIGTRYLDTATTPNDCQEILLYLLVDECQYYDGMTTINQVARTINTCMACKKDFLRWQEQGSYAACTNWAPIKCSKIENCQTTVCFDNVTEKATPGSYSYGCRMCDKNYSGETWDTVNGAGSKTCVKKNVITNCEFSIQRSATVQNCYSCASGYAVGSAQTSCTSFTNDSNCRLLHSGEAYCHYCWHSYYWDTKTCALNGRLGKLSLAIVAVMAMVAFVWMN